MLVRHIDWPQDKTWAKEFPPEMVYLYTLGLPGRQATGGIAKWNWFGTQTTIQLNIYDSEAIVLYKLKFGS
jgi:hypothetical protein